MGRLTKIYFPRLYKFVNLKDFLNRHLSLLQNTFGATIILIMVMTKITRIIIIIIMKIVIVIKTIKFTNMIGYHKPQFKLQWDSVRVMLVNGVSYWTVRVMCMHWCHVLCWVTCCCSCFFKYNTLFLIFCPTFDELVINISDSCSGIIQFFRSLIITDQIGLNSVLLLLLIITMIITTLHSLVIVRSPREDHLTNRGHLKN